MNAKNQHFLHGSLNFASSWAVTIAVLFFSYLGVYLMGFQPVRWSEFLLATIPIGLVFALLLEIDRRDQLTREKAADAADMSLWGMIHEIFVRRKSLLAFFLLAAVGAAIGTYYIATSLFNVEYTDEKGIVIQLPGEKIYSVPVHPYYGWQGTNIHLDEGEEFTVEVSGVVSPGFLQTTEKYNKYTQDIIEWRKSKKGAEPLPPPPIWEFTGPAGYPSSWYRGSTKKDYIPMDYKDDPGLTVRGLPHNTLVATILSPGDPMPRIASVNGPGYEWSNPEDKKLLLNFACDHYPQSYTAKKSGELYVVINDADPFRWDNAGWFLLKLTKHFKGHPRTNYTTCSLHY
jgi:hypothetical protein